MCEQGEVEEDSKQGWKELRTRWRNNEQDGKEG